MNILWGPVFSCVTLATDEEEKAVREILRAHPAGYQNRPNYMRKDLATGKRFWDGYYSLVTDGGRFLTGLLPSVLTLGVEMYGLEIVVSEAPAIPVKVGEIKEDYLLDGSPLRPWQMRSPRQLLAATRGLVKGAPRAGKTRMASVIFRYHGEKTGVLIINSVDTFLQLVENMRLQLGEEIGTIQGDPTKWHPRRVSVAMLQTLDAHRQTPQFRRLAHETGVLIMDEVQASSSKQGRRVLERFKTPFRFGLSATPTEYDPYRKMITIGLFGGVVDTITEAELQKHEAISVPHVLLREIPKRAKGVEVRSMVLAPAVPGAAGTGASFAKYRNVFTQGVVENEHVIRSLRKDCEDLVKLGFPTLIQVDTEEHGAALQTLLESLGSVFLTGEDRPSVRKLERELFNKGARPILISTPIFNVGLDFPSLLALIPIGGGRGRVKIPQRLGRGYQSKRGLPENLKWVYEKYGDVFLVIDYINRWHLMLLEHSLERVRIFNQRQAVIHEIGISVEDALKELQKENSD